MSRILLTGGCSFTESYWPVHLAKLLGYQLINEGQLSQGNGIISKRIRYRVLELLKTNEPEDILVGIMWSGFTRHEVFLQETDGLSTKDDGCHKNPVKFINEKSSTGAWLILNHGWKNEYAKRFYSDFNLVAGVINTVENIVATQNFLKIHNIPYFMTTFTSETLPVDLIEHPEVKWLYEQIDFDCFLPVIGEYEWCAQVTDKIGTLKAVNWFHPNREQHTNFVNSVIYPYLEQQQLIQ